MPGLRGSFQRRKTIWSRNLLFFVLDSCLPCQACLPSLPKAPTALYEEYRVLGMLSFPRLTRSTDPILAHHASLRLTRREIGDHDMIERTLRTSEEVRFYGLAVSLIRRRCTVFHSLDTRHGTCRIRGHIDWKIKPARGVSPSCSGLQRRRVSHFPHHRVPAPCHRTGDTGT